MSRFLIGILVMVASLVVGCGGSVTSPQPAATVTVTATPKPTLTVTAVSTSATAKPKIKTYGDGTYLVGKDIPAGMYKGKALDPSVDIGEWAVLSSPNASLPIADGGPTSGQFYVHVKKGEYLQLSEVKVWRVGP